MNAYDLDRVSELMDARKDVLAWLDYAEHEGADFQLLLNPYYDSADAYFHLDADDIRSIMQSRLTKIDARLAEYGVQI